MKQMNILKSAKHLKPKPVYIVYLIYVLLAILNVKYSIDEKLAYPKWVL
jgi:hypothetical protein